jgi:hypothetical protein
MGLILVALLFLSPDISQAEELNVSLAIAPDAQITAAGAAVATEAFHSGLERLFDAQYGRFFHVSRAVGAAGGAEASIRIGPAGAALSLSTDLTVRGLTRSLSSTVPLGSPASLIATSAADLAYLAFLADGFSAFPLSPPPPLTAVLPTDALQGLVGGNPEDREPMGISASEAGLTLGFARGYVTLGPGFRITRSTARDMLAQSREQIPLSGIAAAPDGSVILLSEKLGRIVRVDTLGSRQSFEVPALSGSGARLIGTDTVATVSNGKDGAAIVLTSLRGESARTVRLAASYVSALAVDAEGNIWAWDAGERRIRILTTEGREVFSIRPLFKASIMQLPQQMEVLDDGGFLLAGSGELWRFENTGVPVWRLTRIPGRPGEKLPASFSLAADRDGGSFTIMDGPSRRLISFAQTPSTEMAPLSALLNRLDSRRESDLEQAGVLSRQSGLSLMALQLGDQVVRIGGSEAARAAARQDMLRDAARLMRELADQLQADLLFARADAAYLRAGDFARELQAESPADESAGALLSDIVSRRQDVRGIIARASDLRVVSATAQTAAACSTTITVEVRLRNEGSTPLTGVRVHISLPLLADTPGLTTVGSIGPGEEKRATVVLSSGQRATEGLLTAASAFLSFAYQKGAEGISTGLTTNISLTRPAGESARAAMLACRAAAGDVLLSDLIGALPAPAGSTPPPFAKLVLALDSLGSLRGAGSAPGAPGAAAATGARGALRGLSADETSWALLTSSLAATLGLAAGFVSWTDAVCALVDTHVSLAAALKEIPDLQPHAAALSLLSRDGSLCIPFSGRPAAGRGTAAAAFLDGLSIAESHGPDATGFAWIDPGAVRPSTPRPFPIALPLPGTSLSPDGVLGDIISLMEQDQ